MNGRTTNPSLPRLAAAVALVTAAVASVPGTPNVAEGAVDLRYERGLRLSSRTDGRLLPNAVTFNSKSAELVVTDSAWSALHVFNAAGVETFRTEDFARLASPIDGAVDAAGRLVALSMVDGRRFTIVRLDAYGEPDGWLPASPREGWRPDHLLVTRDGHYVTVDGTSGLLAKHDADTGAVLWTTVIAGPDPDDPTLETAIGRPVEMNDGTFAVPGGNLHNVIVVGADGAVITVFGRFGSSPGRMVTPVAVAEGPQGTLLVLDQMRHKVMVFDDQKQFVTEFGSIGDAPGAFYYPVAMAADGAGHVYVAQGYRGRVQVFNVQADGTAE